MDDLQLSLDKQPYVFQPGEHMRGRFAWNLQKTPKLVELRLVWYTQGKGTQDIGVVQVVQATPKLSGNQAFEFVLPPGPYSFSGRLITIAWALELVVKPGDNVERIEFVLSPTGQEIMTSPTFVIPR